MLRPFDGQKHLRFFFIADQFARCVVYLAGFDYG